MSVEKHELERGMPVWAKTAHGQVLSRIPAWAQRAHGHLLDRMPMGVQRAHRQVLAQVASGTVGTVLAVRQDGKVAVQWPSGKPTTVPRDWLEPWDVHSFHHVGISGEPGSGVTSALCQLTRDRRHHRQLVDVLAPVGDTKWLELADASGVRVHTTPGDMLAAWAEFTLSSRVKPAHARHDTPRSLVIDDLRTVFSHIADWCSKQGLPEADVDDWLGALLTGGRATGHYLMLGLPGFSDQILNGPDLRDQLNTKIMLAPIASDVAARAAFGDDAPIADIGNEPGLALVAADGGEPQAITIRPEAHAPDIHAVPALADTGWFDDGELAPWISARALLRSGRDMFRYLPGAAEAPENLAGQRR